MRFESSPASLWTEHGRVGHAPEWRWENFPGKRGTFWLGDVDGEADVRRRAWVDGALGVKRGHEAGFWVTGWRRGLRSRRGTPSCGFGPIALKVPGTSKPECHLSPWTGALGHELS